MVESGNVSQSNLSIDRSEDGVHAETDGRLEAPASGRYSRKSSPFTVTEDLPIFPQNLFYPDRNEAVYGYGKKESITNVLSTLVEEDPNALTQIPAEDQRRGTIAELYGIELPYGQAAKQNLTRSEPELFSSIEDYRTTSSSTKHQVTSLVPEAEHSATKLDTRSSTNGADNISEVSSENTGPSVKD